MDRQELHRMLGQEGVKDSAYSLVASNFDPDEALCLRRPHWGARIGATTVSFWPNLAAKPTLRTALCGFTVDPMQPFVTMIQERYATDDGGNSSLRRLPGSLGTIAQSLAEIRNKFWTGHGQAANAKGFESRYAKSTACAAAALTLFLQETHQASSTR